MAVVKKVAITGPESTGKSTLSRQLAAHYRTEYVPEYAREYVDRLDRHYRQEDILVIAKEQLAMERRAMNQAETYLFCDTDLIVPKIWELYKYFECHPWIIEQIHWNRYDLILLCDVDLPWQPDPQREYPNLRQFFFYWFHRELQAYGFPYRIIRGNEQERLGNAIDAVNSFFNVN